jgi:hypothetical protein
MHAKRPFVHPAAKADAEFFRINPFRFFRLREYVKGEFGFDRYVELFCANAFDNVVSVDSVIVRRYPHGRQRVPFSLAPVFLRNTDEAISAFLLGNGIDPATMRLWGQKL